MLMSSQAVFWRLCGLHLPNQLWELSCPCFTCDKTGTRGVKGLERQLKHRTFGRNWTAMWMDVNLPLSRGKQITHIQMAWSERKHLQPLRESQFFFPPNLLKIIWTRGICSGPVWGGRKLPQIPWLKSTVDNAYLGKWEWLSGFIKKKCQHWVQERSAW